MKRIGRTRQLGPRARQVLEYKLEHPKANQKEIAQALGLTHQRISQIIKSNRVLQALPGLARTHLQQATLEATAKHLELMRQNENLEVSRKAVRDVLELSKVLEVTPQIAVNVYQNLTNRELEDAAQRKLGARAPVVETELGETLGNEAEPQ